MITRSKSYDFFEDVLLDAMLVVNIALLILITFPVSLPIMTISYAVRSKRKKGERDE